MDKQLQIVLQQRENQYIEFKENFSDSAIETLVAFANTKGGKVFIGISDKKEIIGVKYTKETIQNWINEIKNKTHPFIVPDVETLNFDKKKIIIFSVIEYPIKPVAFKNKYLKRVSNSNQILSLQEISNIYLKMKNTSWDYYENDDYTIKDLDIKKIETIKNKIEDNLKIKLGSPIDFLRKYELISKNNIPTNASLLLFPIKPIYASQIQIGLFQSDTLIKKSKVIQEDLISEINSTLDFITNIINKQFIITGKPEREEKWQYPLTALREIVINAIIHKDYRDGTHTQIKVFNNKIIFWNIGKLLPGINIEDILKGTEKSHIRNKLIAEVFRDLGLIERYGSGLKRVIDEFTNYGLQKPIFKEKSNGFEVSVVDTNPAQIRHKSDANPT